MNTLLVPALRPSAPVSLPPVDVQRLPNGLRVLSVHRPDAALVDVRLRIPFGSLDPGHGARALLLAETLLAGTVRFDRMALAERLQELGTALSIGVDADQIMISAGVLAPNIGELLGLLGEVLVGASYPDGEVAAERGRLLQRVQMSRSKASVQARETLHQHLYGTHPYGTYLPEPHDLAAVNARELRALHARRIVPTGSALILVGHLDPGRAAALSHAALGGWIGEGIAAEPIPDVPPIRPDPSLLVHRPGSVQSSIRIGGPALRRDDRRYPALQLANLLYGGYFSSRLINNIREEKGYSYSPRSHINHGNAGATLVVEADVATAVTAPALLEMWYELGRLSTLRPTGQELEDVRQYAAGSLAMSIATQSGLATTLTELTGVGLGLEWVREHPRLLAAVTSEDIYDIGVHILAPCRLAVVVIGDAAETAEPLKAFGPWKIQA